MKFKTTKDLLQDLANLDISKEVWLVCEEWTYEHTKEKCPSCNGEGKFKHGNQIYDCQDCRGTGKVGENVKKYVVKRATYGDNKYPEVDLRYNSIEMPFYYDIQGFFNDYNKAQEAANKLNKFLHRI